MGMVYTRESLLATVRQTHGLWGPTRVGTIVVQGAETQAWVLRMGQQHSGNSSLDQMVFSPHTASGKVCLQCEFQPS